MVKTMKNYYEILEVNKKASKEVIEKAYKVLVKKYHPDLYKGEKQKYAEKKIRDINEAYDVLSDEFLKRQYDVELERELEKIYEQKYKMKNEENEQQFNNHTNQTKSASQRNASNNSYTNQEKLSKQEYRRKMSSFSGMIELTKELYKDKPKRDELKKFTLKDIIAIIITIIVIILIGMILWFIPFTNSWMRELLFENPFFNWIGSLFS